MTRAVIRTRGKGDVLGCLLVKVISSPKPGKTPFSSHVGRVELGNISKAVSGFLRRKII